MYFIVRIASVSPGECSGFLSWELQLTTIDLLSFPVIIFTFDASIYLSNFQSVVCQHWQHLGTG